MKLGVLALDYDGTIARDGVLDPDVKASLLEARARGISVVLVTGRILPDLKHTTGGLNFVDAVVAENGAVLAIPPDGLSRRLVSPPSPVFLKELTRRGLEFLTGESVVELDSGLAPQVLQVVTELELPLVLLFNRDRLMVLPQGTSKGNGLREAMKVMRLSVHNTLGMGDAENDHDLLATCEVGVAVGWGSPVLQREADEVVHGGGPASVAAYIRQMTGKMTLPTERIASHRSHHGSRHGPRHTLTLGTTEDGHVVDLAASDRNILIAGDPRSGKSWAGGVLCEQLILKGYSVCVVDTQGSYRGLESLPGVLIVGGHDELPGLDSLARVLRRPDMNMVIDLSQKPHAKKHDFLRSFLPVLTTVRRESGFPHHVLLDELDEATQLLQLPTTQELPMQELPVQELLDSRLGGNTFVTSGISGLPLALASAIDAFVFKRTTERATKRTTEPSQIQFVRELTGEMSSKGTVGCEQEALASLGMNQALLVLGRDNKGQQPLKFDLLPRVQRLP